jgi:hypothetical protein
VVEYLDSGLTLFGRNCGIEDRLKLKIVGGVIYCITAIFLVIAVLLYDLEIYYIGLGIGEQMIVSPISSRLSGSSNLPILQNIIPMFTLVYVGLKNADSSHSTAHARQISSNGHTAFRSGVVLPCQVLLNEPQSTEVKAGECV